ncbi:MAG: lipopolysaccharide heptosyltransferase II [Verrucomicrobiales bacterium]
MPRSPAKPKKPSRRRQRGAVSAAGQWLVYGLFRAVESGLRLLPLGACWRLGNAAGFAVWLALPGYRRLARRNLEIAFGDEMDERGRRRLVRRHFCLLGANFASAIRLPYLPPEKVDARIEIEGAERLDAVAAAGGGMVCMISHLGCWELLAQFFERRIGMKAGTLFQPLGNRWLDAHVRRQRAARGTALFDRSTGVAGPLAHLREGGALGILMDQHAGDKGVWCPLFGRLASTTNLPALLAARSGATIVPFAVFSSGPARWRMVVEEPVAPDAEPDAAAMTARLNRVLEAQIRRSPADWFWVHDRWKTPRPAFLLERYRRGVVLPPGGAAQLKPFRLLVRSPNWLGDACMALPAVRAIKAGRPDARVTVLCPDKIADLWRAMPEVDAVIGKGAKDSPFRVAAALRKAGRFDAAILLPNSVRSALEVWLARIPRIAAFPGHNRRWLVDQIVPEAKEKIRVKEHHAKRYLRIAQRLGAEVDLAAELPMPARHEPPEEGEIRIGLCAGAEYGPAKRWPLDRFAAAARQVSAQVPAARWILVGAPKEAPLGEELAGMLGSGAPHENLVGKTSLAELIAELKRCRLVLTNDTGTMHLAAALGIPTVSLVLSTEHTLTGPLGAGHRILRHKVECSPCFRRECPIDFPCATGIAPGQASAAVLELLGQGVERC